MGLRFAAEILQEISFHLVEKQLLQSNTLGANVAAPGAAVIPFTTPWLLYVGAQLICGTGGNIEVITVSAVTATTFTATFANVHPPSDPLWGATFPSCQTDSAPLWRQSQVLDFLGDAQNDFLQEVNPIFAQGTVNLLVGRRIYAWPVDALRVERISIEGTPLWNVSQFDLDTEDPSWESATSPVLPDSFYQDNLADSTFGVSPPPSVGDPMVLWYPQKASRNLGMLSTFLVPDVMIHYVKYRTMQRMLEVDGEQRDPKRADYCKRRYDLGVEISKRFIVGMDTALKAQQAQAAAQASTGGSANG